MPLKRTVLIRLAGLFLLPFLPNVLIAERPKAKVEFRAVSVFGKPITGFSIDEISDSAGGDFAKEVIGNATVDLPYGSYRIVGYKAGFLDADIHVEIFAPKVIVTLCFELPAMESELRLLTPFVGNVVGSPVLRSTGWCKASGLYLRLEYEAELQRETQQFDFGAVAPGTYIVTCVAAGSTIAIGELVVVSGNEPYKIAALSRKKER